MPKKPELPGSTKGTADRSRDLSKLGRAADVVSQPQKFTPRTFSPRQTSLLSFDVQGAKVVSQQEGSEGAVQLFEHCLEADEELGEVLSGIDTDVLARFGVHVDLVGKHRSIAHQAGDRITARQIAFVFKNAIRAAQAAGAAVSTGGVSLEFLSGAKRATQRAVEPDRAAKPSSGDERSLEQPAIESAPDSEALEANSLGAAARLEAVVTQMRESVSANTKVEFDSVFEGIRAGFVELRRPAVQLLQEYLDGLEGLEFGSLEANKEFMIGLRSLLSDLGVDVACTKAGCERHGKPRVVKTNSPHGSFGVDHTTKPVLKHGSSPAIPRYLLRED